MSRPARLPAALTLFACLAGAPVAAPAAVCSPSLALAAPDAAPTLPIVRPDAARAQAEGLCALRLPRLGPYLAAADNLQCGGANVTFSGVYRRAGKAP